MVQREVLNKVKADNLLVHVVWTPVLGNDNRDAAVAAEELFDDERVLQYWDGDLDLGLAYGRIVELPAGRDLAWDIYFVFDEGTRWEGSLPVPAEFAHQLGMDERHLGDGNRLRRLVEEALKRAAEGE